MKLVAGVVLVLVGIAGAANAQEDRDRGHEHERGREAAYTRHEAYFIANRIYGALLGRRADRSGAENAVPRIEQGRVRGEVETIVRSPEFRRDRMAPEEMLEQIYQGLLGRSVDDSGRRSYLGSVRSGRHADVVMSILESSEFKRLLRDTR